MLIDVVTEITATGSSLGASNRCVTRSQTFSRTAIPDALTRALLPQRKAGAATRWLCGCFLYRGLP